MTHMTTSRLFQMPDINDQRCLDAHRDAVMLAFADVFDAIDQALEDALPKVLDIFKLFDGPVDLAVHAPNARYLVKQFLAQRAVPSFEEDVVEIEMQAVSNCGLCAKTSNGTIRILKNCADGLPKALSATRERFSSANQLIFRFDPAADKEPKVASLNFFALWRMDAEYKYAGLQIALPRTVRQDGTIECYWISDWRKSTERIVAVPAAQTASDLDEITPKAQPKTGKL